jgi:hypothetical protein
MLAPYNLHYNSLLSEQRGTRYLGCHRDLRSPISRWSYQQETQIRLDFESSEGPTYENAICGPHSTRKLAGSNGMRLCWDLALPGEIYYDQDPERD